MKLKEFLSLYEESRDRVNFIFLRKATPEDNFYDLEEFNRKKYYRFNFTLEELLGDEPKFEDFSMSKEDFENSILKYYFEGQEFLKREVESFTLEEDWVREENFNGDMEYNFNAINILIILKN